MCVANLGRFQHNPRWFDALDDGTFWGKSCAVDRSINPPQPHVEITAQSRFNVSWAQASTSRSGGESLPSMTSNGGDPGINVCASLPIERIPYQDLECRLVILPVQLADVGAKSHLRIVGEGILSTYFCAPTQLPGIIHHELLGRATAISPGVSCVKLWELLSSAAIAYEEFAENSWSVTGRLLGTDGAVTEAGIGC